MIFASKSPNPRVLVLGSTGMIGGGFVRRLLKDSEFRKAGDLVLPVRKPNLMVMESARAHSNVHIVSLDEPETWSGQYDIIFHAASPASPTKYKDHVEIYRANIGMLESINRNCETDCIFFVSTGEVYGDQHTTPVKETDALGQFGDDPRSHYPKAKLEAESYLIDVIRSPGTKVAIARLFHTFGPGMKKNDGRSFADFIWSASAGEPVSMRSKKPYVRSFAYLDDSISSFERILENNSNECIFNVGSDIPILISDFAAIVAAEARVELIINEQPDTESYKHSGNVFLVPDLGRMASIGWSPRFTLEEAIKKTLVWAKSELRTA